MQTSTSGQKEAPSEGRRIVGPCLGYGVTCPVVLSNWYGTVPLGAPAQVTWSVKLWPLFATVAVGALLWGLSRQLYGALGRVVAVIPVYKPF